MRSLVLFSFLLCALLVFPHCSEGMDKDENYMYVSCDPRREPVMDFDLPTILYQEKGVLIRVKEGTEEGLSIFYKIQNGTIVTLDEHGLRSIQEYSEWGVYRWDGETEGELQTSRDGEIQVYNLAPDYLDVDYEMTLRITVLNGSEEIYWEEHHFYVIGEPIIIEGHDPFEEISVRNVLLISFIIAFSYWTFVFIMARSVRYLSGRGKK
ncbi:MAG: hypothetical protein JXA22_07690 [Candidatus Thermoplasmatota archaeon]|nr:hypothetical protein [Candidatus Thermoplasmatota archaeon]